MKTVIAKDSLVAQQMEIYRERSVAARRAAMARLLLTEDELRAEDAAEEADLRELASADRAEVSIKGS